MAIKVKRKQTRRQAAKEPDQIYTLSERTFNTLEQNKKLVLGGLAGVLVLIVGITLVARASSSSTRADGAELMGAALMADAPLGEAVGDEADVPRFANATDRAEALRAAVADQIGNSDPPAAARLLDAVASVQLGDLTRAESQLQAVSEAEDLPLSAVVALQGLAATRAANQGVAAAQQPLEALQAAVPELVDFGDLERARLAEAAGELVTALALYESVAMRGGLVITDAGRSTPNEAIIEAARHRAEVLSVLLGRTPAPASEDEPGGEGSGEGSE